MYTIMHRLNHVFALLLYNFLYNLSSHLYAFWVAHEAKIRGVQSCDQVLALQLRLTRHV